MHLPSSAHVPVPVNVHVQVHVQLPVQVHVRALAMQPCLRIHLRTRASVQTHARMRMLTTHAPAYYTCSHRMHVHMRMLTTHAPNEDARGR
jgi:hypothetical protein